MAMLPPPDAHAPDLQPARRQVYENSRRLPILVAFTGATGFFGNSAARPPTFGQICSGACYNEEFVGPTYHAKIFRFVGRALGYAILKYFTIESPVLDCLELGVMEENSTSCTEAWDPSEILPNSLAMIQFFPSYCFERQSLAIHSTTAGLFTLSLACRSQNAKIRKMVYQAYYVDVVGLYKLLPIGDIHCLTLKEEDVCKESDDEDTNHICIFDLLDGLDSLKEIRLFDPKHLHGLSVLLDKHPKILPSLKNLVLRFRQCEEHFT
ncbi:hypothetical protein BDN71DRAFT_1501504 [Pleurotus eryngii]|uniref:Uncharacterized protein n=1 Tax=Pleurotus eryngii TaxID=5323 RepID=A0A9P6DJN9_PLEER|nr:hypothetical protein BDN71DRAFT_1501504 [Pleurotus eryngii]